MARGSEWCRNCGRNLPSTGKHECPPLMDLTGESYGKLTVVRMLPGRIRRSTIWECRCACGATKVTNAQMLRSGHAKSCGCLNVEQYSKPRKHGACNTPEYSAWKDMKRRCLNPKAKNYRRYGGRGVSICERWMEFSLFLADMGTRPQGLSLERINNNGNYEPGNCKWATDLEQSSNTCRNRFVELNGERKTVSAFARELGVSWHKAARLAEAINA